MSTRLHARRLACSALLSTVLLVLAGCSSGATTPDPDPTPTTPTVTTALDDYVAAGSVEVANLRSVAVSRGGQVLADRYYDSSAAEYMGVESVTKSVISTLVGVALAEGKLTSLDQTVGELLPQDRALMKKATAAITVRELLTMKASWAELPEGTTLESTELVRRVLQVGPDQIGTFSYNNVAPHILSAILVQVTGQSTLDYARAKLFDPLGIETRPAYEGPLASLDTPSYAAATSFTWLVDPDGVHAGFSSIKLTTGDMLKLGQLYLDEGMWQGRQLVPASYIAEATAPQPGDYGYLWWSRPIANHPAYEAFGSFGQMIMVVEDLDLVVVASSRPSDTAPQDQEYLIRMVETYVVPNLPA